nr:zinc dependent phospholipase C family protein [Lachnospiraceae bacterium]
MKRVSHRVIGRYLAGKKLSDKTFGCRLAFMVGNSIPDYIYASYLKGWKIKKLRGHNFPNCYKYLDKLEAKIDKKFNKEKYSKLWYCFKMGVFMHYTTDAFTYAHNNYFEGNIHQHRLYEAMLHAHFMDVIEDNKQREYYNTYGDTDVVSCLKRLHDKYEREERCVEVDTSYIFEAINMIM